MGKMVVLKPVVWNDNGYTWPAGIPAGSGYSQEHGYGHEEWNGRSDWIWDGWKVFHTQSKGRMHDYAALGRLGIIMTTMKGGKFFAVGVGCNVYENSDADNVEIAAALDLLSYKEDLWSVPAISERKSGRRAFERHWRDHMHVNWRCPHTHFAWFGRPIPIVPNQLIPANPPRQAIAKMHGSYQAIRPDQALSIVRRALAADHSIVGWLSTGDFDPVRNRSVRGAPAPKGGRNSAATPVDPVRRYIEEYELVVSPRHHILQTDFERFLRSRRLKSIQANVDRVDLRFTWSDRGDVLVEIKPTDPSTLRFAVRTAMGQLLDYRQRATDSHSLLIVQDDEPGPEDADLALTNGFAIAWRSGTSFDWKWPA
jgi:hypothetical protein